jgi:cell division protein FtsL
VIRLSSFLASLLVVCALALVTSQHRARQLFSELTQQQELARQIDVEWGQLQLEQSTWAMHARVEKIATGRLQMRVPASGQVRLVLDDLGEYVLVGPRRSAEAPSGARKGGASDGYRTQTGARP